MAKDKIKKDSMTKRVENTTRQIAHLQAEIPKIQALIDDPDNTDDVELEADLAELQQSLQDQMAKLAKLTGSTVPTV
jgi:predicted  nucleic acid-binding Zn-ribbon protein